MDRPTNEQFAMAARVLRYLEEVEGVDPDDLGMVGHLAWVCDLNAGEEAGL